MKPPRAATVALTLATAFAASLDVRPEAYHVGSPPLGFGGVACPSCSRVR